MSIYKPDITEAILGALMTVDSMSYTDLYQWVIVVIGRTISHRDYAAHLERMSSEKWLSKTDKKIRGTKIFINIQAPGRFAYNHKVILEEWSRLNRSITLLLIGSSMGIPKNEKIMNGNVGPGSVVINYPLAKGPSYFNVDVIKGFRLTDLTRKSGTIPFNILHYIDFGEKEIRQLVDWLEEKSILTKNYVYEDGAGIPEYHISTKLSDFVSDCFMILTYNLWRQNYWLSYIDESFYKRDIKAEESNFLAERNWLMAMYGKQVLRDDNIRHDFIRSTHRRIFKNEVNRMKGIKIPDNSSLKKSNLVNIKGITIAMLDLRMVGHYIHNFDELIIHYYKEVTAKYEKLVDHEDYALFAALIMDICHPKIFRVRYLNKLLKLYRLTTEDFGISKKES